MSHVLIITYVLTHSVFVFEKIKDYSCVKYEPCIKYDLCINYDYPLSMFFLFVC